ncbi:hypothetical protein SCHPADRAFT_945445 [Schizopora paradoxa]|uniref:Uncharacterized protein n=1 Tax=Schizopora paradoxa TaxID=27342 RepID=A0A0H2R5V6_9AGAM|nr:hypothetical protein SCHPADRAFT_945445 [Schizopora paradoxa]
MSPIIIPIIVGLAELLAVASPAITVALVNTYMLSVIYGKMNEADAIKVQADIESRLSRFFGPKERVEKLPVRNDFVVPAESGNGEVVPLKVLPKRSMTNSSTTVWLQDPLREGDYGHRIITLFPLMTRSPSMTDVTPLQNPNFNPFYPNGPPPTPPSGDSGPPTPTFPELPYTGDITPYCRPWPHGGPFYDPDPSSGGGAGSAVPIMAVAVGGAETKRQDVLDGIAGRVPKYPCISVYAKELPDIVAGSESSSISTRGSLVNNTRFTLIMRRSGELRAAYANHGYALANSSVCFPGQTIQVGGQSSGAGVEVAFRFQVWDIPYVADHNSLSGDLKTAVDAIEKDPRGLSTFVMKPETSNMVGNLYCFIDIPKVGSSKVNCFEASKEDIKDLSKISDVAGGYNFLSGSDHTFSGSNIQGTFNVGYGSTPTANFVLSNKV